MERVAPPDGALYPRARAHSARKLAGASCPLGLFVCSLSFPLGKTLRSSPQFVSWRYVADGTVTMLSGAYNILPSAKRAVMGPLRNLIRLTDPLVYARWRPPPRNLFDAQDVDIVKLRFLFLVPLLCIAFFFHQLA